MHDFDKLEKDEKMAVIERVKKHLSEIMIVFRQAKDWLEDDVICIMDFCLLGTCSLNLGWACQ